MSDGKVIGIEWSTHMRKELASMHVGEQNDKYTHTHTMENYNIDSPIRHSLQEALFILHQTIT